MHYSDTREFAKSLDHQDSLAYLREEFVLPPGDAIYFQGNSIGPPLKKVGRLIEEEIERWGTRGMENLFGGPKPWIAFIKKMALPVSKLIGAKAHEVTLMNGLSVNIHLLFTSFYRPNAKRHKVLIEYPAFSSDLYAIKSQIRLHGFDPEKSIVTIEPREGEWTLRQSDIDAIIDKEGEEIALVFFSGVNFITGQAFDIEEISKKAKEKGAYVGFDLAHAVGNIPLELHKWGVDFAVWCSYKYLSGGAGAIAGAYIHEKHHYSDLPQLTGWWGVDPNVRFQFQLCPDFVPEEGAGKWQVCNPPILGSIPLEAYLELFDQIGMEAFRQKSLLMTDYLLFLLEAHFKDIIKVITPIDAKSHGCQLSILIPNKAKKCMEKLTKMDIFTIFRKPDILRIAPHPFYNRFEDLWRFNQALREILSSL